jgi:hypothetical protein
VPIAPFDFDREWEFDAPPEHLWAALARTDDYTTWWPWLRSFDAPALLEGATARCSIRSPLPYSLSVTITVLHVVEGELVETRVGGDLTGPARLEIVPRHDGSAARLRWRLELAGGFARTIAGVGRPLAAWAHDAIVAMGVEQFRRRALAPGFSDVR